MKTLPYIAIIVLLVIIFLQRSCSPIPDPIPPKIDTVYVHNIIHDTIPGKPQYISTKIDTSIWMKKVENKPDTTYSGLLYQYKELGNRYFSTNVFKSEFQIEDYGKVTVTDSIYGNWLMNSTLVADLDIVYPEITITKTAPPKNQMYIGTTFTGNKSYPISGVYGGLMLKTKKDRLYGASIGWTGEITYGFSLYYKIKLRK